MDENGKIPEFNRIKPMNKDSQQAQLQRKDSRLKKIASRENSFIYVKQ